MSMIEITGLNLSFGTGAALNAVLHDVDLSVAEGEAFGLVGSPVRARPPCCVAWPDSTSTGPDNCKSPAGR